MALQDGLHPTYFLAWIPESLLDERGHEEWEKYVSVETSPKQSSEALDDEGAQPTSCLHSG